MIDILIDKPHQLSDNILVQYCAYIAFPYESELVRYLQDLTVRAYNSANRTWEIPIQNLAKFCNTFKDREIYVHGIYQDLSKQLAEHDIPKDYVFKTKPFDHQLDAVKYSLNRDRFILADEQGLGKTKVCIDSANCKQDVNKVLIICGVNSLKYNWLNEIGTHSDEKAIVLGDRLKRDGSHKSGTFNDKMSDLENLSEDTKFIITNIESMRAGSDVTKKGKRKSYTFPLAEKIQELCDQNVISMIIFDEAHKCFSYDTLVSTDLGELRIGDIVENNINCSVKSFNTDTNEIEYKEISGWFKNNTTNSSYVELTFEDKKTIRTIKCTDNHKFYTQNRGWVQAKDLTEDDEIVFI